MDVLIPTLVLGGTGLLCGAVLAIAARFLAVHEDPRVVSVLALLPGINCGGCGYAGCAEYARDVVFHRKDVALCRPGGAEAARKIAGQMGVEAVIAARSVALVLCNGDASRSRWHGEYNGIADCAAADLPGGAGKACRFGCLGFGSCARVCPVGAIEVGRRLAVVHPELCIACGRCVAACPRKLIRLVPEAAAIHVLCRSTDRGPDVKKVCDVGCIGCGICVKTAGGNGIRLEGALAVVDYNAGLSNEEVVAKCPPHAIVKRTGTGAA